MQAKIVYTNGDTAIYENVESVDKFTFRASGQEHWRLFLSIDNVVERPVNIVKEIILK